MSDPEFLLYTTESGEVQLQVRLDEETVWLTQAQMADLFQTSKQNVSLHIQNIFSDGELDENAVVKEYLTTASDGKNYSVNHYNLDVVISVGYRVRSHMGTRFRIWATKQLREFLVKGFLLNDQKFREDPTNRYFEELLQRIRDIRSSEKVFWRKVLDIYATSEDYDAGVEATQKFFATVQNKMHWAAHGHTAAEIVIQRADGGKPNVGMTNYPGSHPLVKDTKVAKNYLTQEELSALNLIVSLYLDFAELQALNRRPMRMADWIAKLDDFLRLSEREILNHAGSVSRQAADQRASEEYEKWRKLEANRESAIEADFKQAIEASKRIEKVSKVKE